MELQTITDTQLQALQKLGFNSDVIYLSGSENGPVWLNNRLLKLPTLDLAAKWLREEKNVYIVILPMVSDIIHSDLSKADFFEYRVVYNGSEVYVGEADNYEKALSDAINDAIHMLNK